MNCYWFNLFNFTNLIFLNWLIEDFLFFFYVNWGSYHWARSNRDWVRWDRGHLAGDPWRETASRHSIWDSACRQPPKCGVPASRCRPRSKDRFYLNASNEWNQTEIGEESKKKKSDTFYNYEKRKKSQKEKNWRRKKKDLFAPFRLRAANAAPSTMVTRNLPMGGLFLTTRKKKRISEDDPTCNSEPTTRE